MKTLHSPFNEWHIGVEFFTWFAPDHQLTCKIVTKVITVEQEEYEGLKVRVLYQKINQVLVSKKSQLISVNCRVKSIMLYSFSIWCYIFVERITL